MKKLFIEWLIRRCLVGYHLAKNRTRKPLDISEQQRREYLDEVAREVREGQNVETGEVKNE